MSGVTGFRFAVLMAALLTGALLPLSRTPATVAQDAQPTRLLLEAEHFMTDDAGWHGIAVGQGNYFVDSVGASHFSGGRMLHLGASESAAAYVETTIPASGPYRLWARYEYPWRDVDASFRIVIEQNGRQAFDATYGAASASRMWFFGLPDAPWNDLPHGVEGPVSEAYDGFLESGPAIVRLIGVPTNGSAADRNVDFVYLTDDLTDEFRRRGERLYPLLDEIGRAVDHRTFVRVTNPDQATVSLIVDAQYTLNRAPWRSPSIRIGADGAGRASRPSPIVPGESSPWVNLSCQDTTHPCHLWLRAPDAPPGARVILDVANAPDERAILRRAELELVGSDGAVLTLPPYPELEPHRILAGDAVIASILEGLAKESPPGWAPQRFVVYAALGNDVERRLSQIDGLSQNLRRLFLALGPNAVSPTSLSAVGPTLSALREDGREPPRAVIYGDHRWFPTDQRIEKAQRDLDAAGARKELRGFTYGDEIKLSDSYPSGPDGDTAFRYAMESISETPSSLLWPDGAEAGWDDVRLDGSAQAASAHPRLFIRSRQYQDQFVVNAFRSGADQLRSAFGPDVLIGANFSPHPAFRPDATAFMRLFRSEAFNRASHSDYWWQASEMGPESTGYLLDVFRSGLDGRPGALEPYVMPHAPGNSDRGFLLGLWTAITHGATGVDLFRVGPEQLNTENYVSSDAIDRYRAIRAGVYALGPVEDIILDGQRRPTGVALILSDSTDRWESVTPAVGAGLAVDTKLVAQSANTERKGLWQALRHAHIPVDFVLEEDLTSERIDRYQVLYLVGPQLEQSAATGLSAWVGRGGTLIAVAGAGSRDEFNQPTSALDDLFGVNGRRVEVFETMLRPRVDVPRLTALDRVTASPDERLLGFDALASREPIAPARSTSVLARFSDGSAAVTSNPYGSGEAVLIGTMPGTAYLRSGSPSPPPLSDRGPFMHQPLVNYDPGLRGFISQWARNSTPDWPKLSHPFVEAGLIETPSRVLVPLANFGEPGTEVAMSIPAVGSANRVWSLHQGELPFAKHSDEIDVTLWLDLVDFLVIER